MLLQVAVPSRTDVQEYIGRIHFHYLGIDCNNHNLFYYNRNKICTNFSKIYKFSDLKDEMDQLVGQINGRFSTPRWSPIRYIFGCINQVKTNLPL